MDEWESESEGGNWSLPVHSKHPSEQVSPGQIPGGPSEDREREKEETLGGLRRSRERGGRRTGWTGPRGGHRGGGVAVSKHGWTGAWTWRVPVTAEPATGSKEGQSPRAGGRRVSGG